MQAGVCGLHSLFLEPQLLTVQVGLALVSRVRLLCGRSAGKEKANTKHISSLGSFEVFRILFSTTALLALQDWRTYDVIM
jgi:hypothetical protein